MAEQSTATGPSVFGGLLADPRYVTILSVTMTASLTGNLLSPALPGLAATFDVTNARIGLAVTAYSLPTAFFLPVSGVLADLYGRRRIVIPAMVVFGVAGLAIAFADSFLTILGLLAVQGLASAGVSPIMVTLLGDMYSGPEGATAQGGRVAANKLNNIIVPAVVGFLVGVSWHLPFLLYAVTFVTAVVAFIYLPAPLDDTHDAQEIRATLRQYSSALRLELTDRTLALLVAGGSVRDFVKYAVIPFVPLFAVQSLGASYVAAGTTLSARGVSGVVAAPLAGPLLAFVTRKQIMVLAFGIGAAGIALMPSASDVLTLGLLVGFYGIGDALFAATIKDSVTGATTDEYRAGVISSMMSLKKLAKSIAPAFFGMVLAVAGFGSLFIVAAAIAVGYGALLAVALPADH